MQNHSTYNGMETDKEATTKYLRLCQSAGGFKTPTAMAKAAGVDPSTINRFLKNPDGESVPSTKTIFACARAAGLGSPFSLEPVTRIPLIGEVAGGVWRSATEWDQDEWGVVFSVPDSLFPSVERFALVVRGQSMNDMYPDGTRVICVRFGDIAIHPKNGDKVVVYRRDSAGDFEATIKEFVIEADGSKWLWPRSSDPRFQEAWPVPNNDGDEGSQDGLEVAALVIDSVKREYEASESNG